MNAGIEKRIELGDERTAGELSPRVRRAEQFSKFGLELTRAEDLPTVGYLLREFCAELWDWDAFTFSVRRGRISRHFTPVTLVDTVGGSRVEFKPEENSSVDFTFRWGCLLDCEPVLVNREEAKPPAAHAAFGDRTRASASLIFVPVSAGTRVIGVISVQSYSANRFSLEDQDLLMKVAEIVAPTLLRCRAEERMQEFLRLGERLNQVVDTRGVTRVVANTAANLVGWDFLSLHLSDPETEKLNLVLGLERSGGDNNTYSGDDSSLIPEDSHLRAVLHGRAMALEAAELPEEDKKRLYPFGSSLPLLSSIIIAPIRSMNKVLGLLCLQSRNPIVYGAEETEIIRGLADYCSGSLERAWAQQNLKESEENYRLLVENVNDGIVISQDNSFIIFNNRFANMLGYEPEELALRNYLDVYTEAGTEILNQRASQREAGLSVPDKYETQFKTKSGEALPVEASVRIIPNYRGRQATFAIIRDIRERIEAEEKVKQSEQDLQALVHAMTDIIMVLDENGIYQQHSTGGHHAVFNTGGKLAGMSVFEIFSHEKAEYFIRLFKRALKNRETLNIEYDLPCSAGIQRWYNASISPLTDTTVLMVARDITERRRADEELFRSNARYKALLDGSEDYIFVLDREMRFIHVNSVVEKRFGIEPHNRIGRTLWDIYGTKPAPPFIPLIQQVFDSGKSVTYDDDAVINGTLVCTETVISPVLDRNGEVEAVLGVSRDVTSRRQAAMALQQSEQRYAVAVRGANDGIWDWDLVTDKIYLSPRWWTIIGEPETAAADFRPESWFDRIHPNDVIDLRRKIEDHINGETPHLEDEHRIMHSDGTYRWVLCRGICVRDETGKAVQMAGSISDITARKTAEEKLQYGANHDTLTQLPNRAYFLNNLGKAVARARRRSPDPEQFAVLFLDLDRFKVINDSLGHLAGDELIIATARRLENCVRPGDLVARLGGDEFTVLLEDLHHGSDATRIAQRIIEDLSAPINISGFAVQTTVSIGIAFDRPEYSQPEDLLRDADTAMYRAKATGRNRYQVFDQKMHDLAMEQLHMEGDLRRAVARQEFVLYYQPVYEVATRRLCGFEALIRWNHPEKGIVLPGEFIPLAEENGSIVPIGWWVVDQAAHAAAKFNANRGPDDQLAVSINMSANQFSQANFVTHVSFLINQAGAAPENIIVEVTENCLMDESQNMADVLQGLRNLGIRLDLDDFGTGYSSLSFLRKFPLDMLKIDQSFVKDLGQSEESRQIVSAILDLARGLGLRVTAEGVETDAQLSALVEMGCDWAQGYHFNRSMPFDEAIKLLDLGPAIAVEPQN